VGGESGAGSFIRVAGLYILEAGLLICVAGLNILPAGLSIFPAGLSILNISAPADACRQSTAAIPAAALPKVMVSPVSIYRFFISARMLLFSENGREAAKFGSLPVIQQVSRSLEIASMIYRRVS
jgi:hypothetical protein